MGKSDTLANINLYAVLRNIEDLCELDKEMMKQIAGVDLAIQFKVKNGPSANLSFSKGVCRFKRGIHPSTITLFFTSTQHFNKMMAGEAMPIPLKGITKLKFLTREFKVLTDRLTEYLRPTPELLEDPEKSRVNTILTAYTAFFALAEIGNLDKKGIANAKRIPDGVIQISIQEGPSIYMTASGGHLAVTKGRAEKYRASMTFNRFSAAADLLNGTVDAYSLISTKALELKGYLPMIDGMNNLLAQVKAYL